MDSEKTSAHLCQVSVYPQLVTNHRVSLIQENPPAQFAEKTKKFADEGEIGVFSAEKYFNMKLDEAGSVQNHAFSGRDKQENREDSPWMRSRSRPGTPSVRSESSYNSQTILLRGSIIENRQNKPHPKQQKMNETSVCFGGFRCNGPCSRGKSVNTDQKILGQRRKPGQGSVTYGARKHRPRLHLEPQKAKIHGLKTKDFFPIPTKKADIATNLERKLSMLTWDAIPNAPNSLTASKNNTNSSISSKTHDDTASDASSELFEIDTITNSAYEPSEASVVWSVVTGSLADQSMISDFNVKRVPENTRKSSAPATKGKIPAEKGRSGGILSGCKSHKAISVVETAYRNEKQAKVHQFRIQDLDFL